MQNAQKQLGLLAKSNGMSQQEVYNQLAYMTAQGNIQNAENPIALLNSIAQIQEGGLSGLENILSPLGFAQGKSGGNSSTCSQVNHEEVPEM